MQNVNEEWRAVAGYEGRYEVSSFGRIRSLPRTETARNGVARVVHGGLLKHCLNAQSYVHVSLRKAGRLRLVRLHRLVAEAFVPGRNELHKEVAHLDGDRANPRAENLKWVSKGENESHKFLHGTNPAGERHAGAKLTEDAVREIRARPGVIRALADKYGVSSHAIDDVRRRRTWRHV